MILNCIKDILLQNSDYRNHLLRNKCLSDKILRLIALYRIKSWLCDTEKECWDRTVYNLCEYDIDSGAEIFIENRVSDNIDIRVKWDIQENDITMLETLLNVQNGNLIHTVTVNGISRTSQIPLSLLGVHLISQDNENELTLGEDQKLLVKPTKNIKSVFGNQIASAF